MRLWLCTSFTSGSLVSHVSLLQVVDAKVVVNRPAGRAGSSAAKVAECLVGDETGVIVYAARNEQGTG